MKRRIIASLAVGVCVLGYGRLGAAVVDEYQKKQTPQATVSGGAPAASPGASGVKVPWRNSLIVYENTFSAISLDKNAERTYNPYYVQSLSFQPRYYLTDELSLRGRMDMELELTTSDTTDRARELELSDLMLDLSWTPRMLTIPVVDVSVNPSIRFQFPTSRVSQGASLMLGIGPGFSLRRRFELLKQGRWLRSVGLTYGFRASAQLHEYTTAQLHGSICQGSGPESPGCVQSGQRNKAWRFSNSLGVDLDILEKLRFSATVMFLNDVLYARSPQAQVIDGAGSPLYALGESNINSRAYVWSIFDVSYDALDWLWLSVGFSTYYRGLADDSTYRTPLFNRFSNIFFDVTLPVDQVVSRVRRWF